MSTSNPLLPRPNLVSKLIGEQTVVLPHRLTKETMQSLISQVVDEDGQCKWSRVRFDLSALEFIDPTGVVVLCNLVDYLRRVGANVKVHINGVATENGDQEARG